MTNREKFEAIYREELERVVREHPEDYGYPVEYVPRVVAKMMEAVDRRSFNKDGRAFKATCKRIGIKHTYKDIGMYLLGREPGGELERHFTNRHED